MYYVAPNIKVQGIAISKYKGCNNGEIRDR